MGLSLLRTLGSIASQASKTVEPCTALATVPQALCKVPPAEIIAMDRDTQFMSLPASVRRIAIQRRDFCKAVCLAARIEALPLKTACAKVIAKDGATFDELLHGGKGGGSSLSYVNFRRWLERLGKTRGAEADWHNLIGVTDRYLGHGRPAMIETPEGQSFFRLVAKHYEHENRLSLKEAYRLAVDLGKRAGIHPENMPSYDQVAYHYAHKIDRPSLLQARMGKEWAENHLQGYITRDWTTIAAGELWFGDHHVFDAPCRIADEKTQDWKAVRPWLTGWLDVKSVYLAGWIIRAGEHPDSLAIEDALLHGIRLNGNRPPSVLYTDNGKDYVSRGFAEPVVTPDGTQHSISLELGLRVINALPYNARAKTIERFFRNVAGSFAKYWMAYLGNRPGSRPEAAQYYWDNPETLPTLKEFSEAFAWWLEHIWNSQGNEASVIAEGKAPQEAWDARPAGRPAMGDRQLYMAFLKPIGARTVGRGGRLSVSRIEYQSHELWPLIGQQVLVKIDRFNSNHIWAFKFDGTPLCEVKQVEALSAIDADPEKLSAAMAENRRLLRHSRELHQERTGERKIGAPVSRLAIAQGEGHDDTAEIPEEPKERPAPKSKEIDPDLAADIALIDELKHGGKTVDDDNASKTTADIDLLEQAIKEEQGDND